MVTKNTDKEKMLILETDIKLGNAFTINSQKVIGCGAFGVIYSGHNSKTKEEVAIKIESQKTRTPQLIYEGKILKILQGGTGIPTLHYSAVVGDYAIMIIDYLDKNLEELLQLTKEKKFSLKTVLMIADQIISRIEYLHSKLIIHRDIKPENFLIGLKKKSFLIYIIDYGLAKRFKNPKTGEHIAFMENKQLTGTARYASIYTHLGKEQSRRDDLESLGYVLMYFLLGSLPWQGIKGKTKAEKYKKIMEIKIKTVPGEITSNLPEEFALFFDHIRSLQFDECPKYDYLRGLFRKLMEKNSYVNDFQFDWCFLEMSGEKKEDVKGNLLELKEIQQNKEYEEIDISKRKVLIELAQRNKLDNGREDCEKSLEKINGVNSEIFDSEDEEIGFKNINFEDLNLKKTNIEGNKEITIKNVDEEKKYFPI